MGYVFRFGSIILRAPHFLDQPISDFLADERSLAKDTFKKSERAVAPGVVLSSSRALICIRLEGLAALKQEQGGWLLKITPSAKSAMSPKTQSA